MKTNKLVVSINRPLREVFAFTITPPNSKYWIPDIINEETNELPVQIGTIYKLATKTGDFFEVTVADFKQDEMIIFTSTDRNYHCKYTYRPLDERSSELEYYEWVDKGELEEPFTQPTIEKLKSVMEAL